MADEDINWGQTRALFRDKDTDEIFVKVESGFMEVDDYIEGGRVYMTFEMKQREMEPLGRFSNAQIQAGAYS